MISGAENRSGQKPAKIAVIAGSGLESVGERFQINQTVSFEDVEGLGACTVTGHAGKVLFCKSGEKEFFLVLGRRHVYEGGRYGMGELVQWLAARGTTGLVVVSAAGGLTKSFPPGELVSIDQIIDLQNFAWLQREVWTEPLSTTTSLQNGTPAVRERGLGRHRTNPSRGLTAAVRKAAAGAGVPLARGTLACCAGPAYETPAEVHLLLGLGADLATMSSAPEVLFARRAGLEVAVIGAVTNYATGVGSARVDHAGVLEKAAAISLRLSSLIAKLLDIK